MQEVLKDYDAVGGDVQKLVEKYHAEMEEIKKKYGGSISDIPTHRDEPYWKLQSKLYAVNGLMKDGSFSSKKVDEVVEVEEGGKEKKTSPDSTNTKSNPWGK